MALVLARADGGSWRLEADADGTVLVPGLDRAGRYRLTTITADGASTPWREVEVPLTDARISDLQVATSRRRPATPGGKAAVERRRGTLAHLLPVLGCAASLLAAWWCFGRERRRAIHSEGPIPTTAPSASGRVDV